mmetsp:Transcript_19654/g.24236  ORF Transcript_19654/g.24236 Transcript_19654/m.24236 type:complete len:483 (-) Transcript_19654:46-1494(-)
MTGVSSDAAIARIETPISLLQSDSLLNLIVSIAPPYQINVCKLKKGSLSLSLNTITTNSPSHSSVLTLTERNSILRNLCGMAFHNALDKHPYYLLGGHSASGKASPESALCLASISSYMSVASSIRSKDVELSNIYKMLNDVLATNSFLVGSTASPTLADMDVFFALSEAGDSKVCGIDNLMNLKRWFLAVDTCIKNLLESYSVSSSKQLDLPQIKLPDFDFDVNEPVPVFYYGDEEGIDEIKSTSALSANKQQTPNNDKQDQDKKQSQVASSKPELTEEQKKAAAERRAKKNAEKAKKKSKADAAAPAENADSGGLDASAFDIRVGQIVEAWEHAESDKLWCEKVDLGEAEPRQILSGLRKFYEKKDMENRKVLVLCNLKKRNLVGVSSHGMVLCATNADHSAVEFVVPPEGAKVGERVMFEGFDGAPEAENKFAKKKMLEKLAPDLKTDGNGTVVWKGAKSVTSAGPCVASKGMKDAQVS